MTQLSKYMSPDDIPVFKAGHQALFKIVKSKASLNDSKIFKDGFGKISGNVPAFDGLTHYDLWKAYNDVSIGLSLSYLTKLLHLWDSWLEEEEQQDDPITLQVLKPFDFKKVPKRIEICNGQTYFSKSKW